MNAIVSWCNPKRIVFLLRGEFVLDGMGMIPGAAAVAAIAALMWGVLPVAISESTYSGFLFPAVLFVGGLVFSSRAFKKAHTPGFGIDYLMTPASTVEKFTSRLLISGIGYALGAVAFCVLVSILVLGLRTALGRGVSDMFNPLTVDVLKSVGTYLVINAIFVCGSLYFPRHALVKTALAIGLFMLLVGIYTSVLGSNIFRTIGMDGWMNIQRFVRGSVPSGSVWLDIVKYTLFYGMAPLFWFVGFLRLRELEV